MLEYQLAQPAIALVARGKPQRSTRLAAVHGCALAFSLLVGGGGRADAEPVERPGVIVRVYDAFGVSARNRVQAQATAAAIFAAAGIDIRWRVCGSAGQRTELTSDPCVDPLGALEVSTRLVRSHDDDGQAGNLGFSLVDTDRQSGSLATVFPDRVRATALRAGVPFGALLGRALAHEIGHLLLGTTAHSAQGVMRPRWNLTILRTQAREDWSFSADEVLHIARSLRVRSAGLPASSLAALIVP